MADIVEIRCERCEGSKLIAVSENVTEKCPRCNGTGKILIEKPQRTILQHCHFEPTELRK